VSIHNLRKRHVVAHLLYLDGDVVANVRVGYDHNIAALDLRDSIALVTEVFDFNVSVFAFCNGRAIGLALLFITVSFLGRSRRSGLGISRCRRNKRNAVRFIFT
jgi:hypothetical protein